MNKRTIALATAAAVAAGLLGYGLAALRPTTADAAPAEPAPYGIVREVPVHVVHTVEVPVERVVEKVVEVPVEVPVEVERVVEIADPAAEQTAYVSGYEDGRIEGDDWAVSTFARALATACESEDSTDCYWDAARMGNGIGQSFVNFNGTDYYAAE
ncbi:hypothetical protein ACFWGP_05450 [Agromyces sp. NPDC127015]|uniref:hypothetical protein n=1 Tax=Agromyces sp. NPDC127015 TaxID=3347108 RepID=UPI003651B1E7